MSPKARAYVTCFAFATVFFLVSTLASDVVARTTIGSEGLTQAISQHVYYAAIQPTGTGMLLVPFILVGWMASSVAQRKSMRRGLAFLWVTCSVLGLMYFFGYQDSQHYVTQKMWTAATLSVGLLAFKSVPVLIIAFVTSLIMRRGPRAEP